MYQLKLLFENFSSVKVFVGFCRYTVSVQLRDLKK